MANTLGTSFLHLPLEIRLQIYNLALPQSSRLSIRPILDPEWLFAAPDSTILPRATANNTKPPPRRNIPPLLFASRQVYTEAAPIFYSRATLEISPNQYSPDDLRLSSAFLEQFHEDYAFCIPAYLKLVKTCQVFCDQHWLIKQEAFQAMFTWLVEMTGVREIYLSRKTMQQGRHVGVMVDLHGARSGGGVDRVVDVYARSVSSRLRYLGDCLANREKPLPHVLVYDTRAGRDGQGVLVWKSGWLESDMFKCTGVMDEEEIVAQRREMERFTKLVLADAHLRQAHADGYMWLYKTLHIRSPDQPCYLNGESVIGGQSSRCKVQNSFIECRKT